MISRKEVLLSGQDAIIWGIGGFRSKEGEFKNRLEDFADKINLPADLKEKLLQSGKLAINEEMGPILEVQAFLKGIDPTFDGWWQIGWLSVFICNVVANYPSFAQMEMEGLILTLNNLLIDLVGIEEADAISDFIHQLMEASDEEEKEDLAEKIFNRIRYFASSEDKKHIQGEVIMRDKIEVKVGNQAKISGGLFVAHLIESSFNKVASTDASDDLKKLLEDLSVAVGKMTENMSEETRKRAAKDLDRLIEEATTEQPEQRWWQVSVEGLTEAAKNIGEVGEPVLEIIARLVSTLTGLSR